MEAHLTENRPQPQWVPALFLTGASAALVALVLIAMQLVGARAGSLPMPDPLLPWHITIFTVIVVLLGGIIIRKIKTRMAWELILSSVVLLGVWLYAWVALSGDIGLLVASVFTVLQAWIRRAWIHNAFLLVGVAGAALNLAFLLPIGTLLVLLVGWAAYDTFVGRPGGIAARFAASVVHRGVVPALIVPTHLPDAVAPVEHAIRKEPLLLGAGDLILPLLFVTRASVAGMRQGIAVAAGLMIAAGWIGWRGTVRPVPPLAPFAIGVGLPTVLLILFHVL